MVYYHACSYTNSQVPLLDIPEVVFDSCPLNLTAFPSMVFFDKIMGLSVYI